MTAALALALVISGVGPDAEAIRVDDVVLTVGDVASRARDLRVQGKLGSAKQLGETMVAELLLAADARRAGVADDVRAKGWVAYARQQILSGLFVERKLGKDLVPTDAQVRALFHEKGDVAGLQLIVVSTREEAQAIRNRLAAGGDWALEASRSLANASARGETGPVTRRTLDPAIAELAFTSPLNQLQGPIALTLGFGVFRVTERTLADEAGLGAQRAALEANVRAQLLSAAKHHLLKAKRAQAKVSVDEPFLKSLGSSLEPTPAQASHAVATIDGRPVLYAEVLPAMRTIASLGGHAAGPVVRQQIVEAFIDERLLATAGVEAGLDRVTDVARRLWLSEQQTLAAYRADAIRAAQKAGWDAAARERALVDRISDLRKRSRIKVNEAGLEAALAG